VCPLVPAKAPLPEEVIFNRNHAAAEKRRAARKTQHKNARSPSAIETTTTSRGGRRGSVASPLMKIHRWSRRGAATLPARRWIGVRCRCRPCRRLLAPQKCRHHGGRRWPRAIRMWARARDKQLALPEKISGPSVPARSPAGRAPRVAKCHAPPSCPPEAVGGAAISRSPTLRWSGLSRLRLLAEASVTGEVDGLCVDTERAAGSGSRCRPAALAVVTYPGRQSPGRSRVPHHRWGQGPTLAVAEAGGSAPVRSGERVAAVEVAVWSGAAPELAGSKRAAAEQGSSVRPVKKSRVRSKM
jgi:hypothetical protein